MILAIYDLSGIQSFIFATNKLKEMVGGSDIVTNALSENIPCVLGESREDWKGDNAFSFSDSDVAKTVYIGGGNALVAFADEATYEEKTKELQKKVFLQTGGALKLCSAFIETDTSNNLNEVQKALMDELDRQKRTSPTAATAKGFSLNAHDNETFEPVILVDDSHFFSKSRYLKRTMTKKQEERKYKSELNLFFDEPDKRMIAVIHIDGNTMGIKIREFVSGLNSEKGLIYQLDEMRKLSMDISKVYKDTLNDTINEMFPDVDKRIPFRPIVSDGDDITVVCRCDNAFDFVEKFMKKLSEKEIKGFEEQKLSAGAGIAFVNVSFPFCTAYDMAEQLCKSAKKKAIESKKYDKSSVDFQACLSGITTDIQEFRNRNYAFTLKRPYVFDSDDKSIDFNDDESIDFNEGFWNQRESVIKSGIARSKLKGLRNEYGKGISAAEVYWDFLKARSENEEMKGLPDEPFVNKTATCFDILDVMDLIEDKEVGVSDKKDDRN